MNQKLSANGRKARKASPWGKRPHVDYKRQNSERMRKWEEKQQR